jgi:uncharacterized protein (TIGR03086 family)
VTESPAERHRRIAGGFSARVAGVAAGEWDVPAPVPEWTARDVVRHLVDWSRAFLSTGAGVELPEGPSIDDDPAAAWQAHVTGVQALVDDPGDRVLSNPHTGDVPLAEAVDRFYTSDVLMHTWDLARATGQDDRLDEADCAELYDGMAGVDEMLRASGQYGPAVPVAANAPVQDRLIGFIGRDPGWEPPAREAV